ncbi:MAG: TonB-dependent receptor plug domain-containing protein, partial [Spirochaetia bacterium]|nr:TonB-dependent receptor plug domain-containing protein [Spirochaetia bacterium]
MKFIATNITILFLFFCGFLLAEETKPAAYNDEIVITARGYGSLLSKTPGGTGVIKSSDIEHMQLNSVSNALELVPGVSKTSDSAWGSEVTIRGASRSNVVFLVDGIRLNTATDVGAQFGTIDPMSVERIEILKGPISSLYGSGTIGGVINVITKNASFADTSSLAGGLNTSYNFNSNGKNLYGFAAFNSESFYAFASGSYRQHDSYEDGGGELMRNSQFEDFQGNINLGFKVNRKNKVELKSQYYQGNDIGIPAGSAFPNGATVYYDTINRLLLNIDYTFTPGAEVFKESKLRLSYHGLGRNVVNYSGQTPVVKLVPEAVHRTFGALWINRIITGTNDITAGADGWLRTLETARTRFKANGETSEDTPIPDSSYLSGGVFAEDNIDLNRFIINLGARFDLIHVENDEAYLYKTFFVTPPPSPPASGNKKIWNKDKTTEYSWNAHAG